MIYRGLTRKGVICFTLRGQFWALCLSYTPSVASAPSDSPVAGSARRKPSIDYREVLNEEDFKVYAQVRSLRKEFADREGIPAYAVFNNEQLATMVRQRVSTLEALAAIENVGPARIEKYGARFLADHAACFADRVFHHALMNLAGPVLERTLVPSSYACRPAKGVHAAVRRVQHHLLRWPWAVQIDIDGYFPAIEHRRLMGLLERRFKGDGFLATLWRVIASHQDTAGRGLPIGSLTSQHFANYYLDGLDRYLLETLGVLGHVRYMDNIVWCCDSSEQAKETLAAVRAWASEQRGLTVKASARIQRSGQGLAFCGYRVLPGALRLSLRRRRRYRQRREHWEQAFAAGAIDAATLQRGYAAVHSITVQADARQWRREQLRRCPPNDA